MVAALLGPETQPEARVTTNDIDSHEMAPMHLWGEMFGPASGSIAGLLGELAKNNFAGQLYCPEIERDAAPINNKTVWSLRGNRAPGAFDMSRRIEVMNVMGIEKQLLFSTYGVLAQIMATGAEGFIRQKWGVSEAAASIDDIRRLGREAVDEFNQWAVSVTEQLGSRIRPVAYVLDDGTPAGLIREAESLVKAGIRAVNLPAGTPPGGVSPASPQIGPFWELLEKNNIPFLLHVGGELGFQRSSAWADAPAFRPGRVDSVEIERGIEPYSFAVMHLPVSNYLTAMTLGGVFEQFPRLRCGIIELGASWFGSFAEGLDMWAGDVFSKRLREFVRAKPSEYLNRNVRISPFNYFEKIALQFSRYPQLSDSYCYSSDYPHVEGGLESPAVIRERIKGLGDELCQKYFFKNAEWLLP
jgi:predicted TIM-barrel fold metal-dependent hydrolase